MKRTQADRCRPFRRFDAQPVVKVQFFSVWSFEALADKYPREVAAIWFGGWAVALSLFLASIFVRRDPPSLAVSAVLPLVAGGLAGALLGKKIMETPLTAGSAISKGIAVALLASLFHFVGCFILFPDDIYFFGRQMTDPGFYAVTLIIRWIPILPVVLLVGSLGGLTLRRVAGRKP